MDRRRYLAGLVLATGLAGCSDTAYRDPDVEGTPTASSTPAPTDNPTAAEQTATSTETAAGGGSSGDFQPEIVFENCALVVVDAPAYDAVTLYFGDTSQTFSGGYEGRDDFKGRGDYTGRIIEKVRVTHGDDTAQRANPDLGSC